MRSYKNNINGQAVRFRALTNESTIFSSLNEELVEGVETIWGYQLREIPEFDLSDRGRELFQRAVLRQKMFIDTANQWLRNRVADFTIELRFGNKPDQRIIECFLLIRVLMSSSSDIQPETVELAADELERMLPEEYNFAQLKLDQLENLLALSTKSTICEIQRNCQLTPVGNFSGLYRSRSIVAKSAPFHYKYGEINEPVSGYEPSSTYLVPGLALLATNDFNWFNLFRMIQEADEVVKIRISLRSEPLFAYDKALATQYYGLLMDTYHKRPLMENQIIDGLLMGMGKFMHVDWLWSVQMQVASVNATLVTSIATTLTTQITNGNSQALATSQYLDNSTIQEAWQLCRQLYQPYTQQPKRWSEESEAFLYRIRYLYSDAEVGTCFRFPVADAEGLPGFISKPARPFYQIPPRTLSGPTIRMGKVITAGSFEVDADEVNTKNSTSQRLNDYEVPIRDLSRHGIFVGTPGSGKTTTTLNFVAELVRNKLPFLIIEPVKSEYYNELKSMVAKQTGEELLRFHFNKPRFDNGKPDPSFLRFNPLLPFPGITLAQHITYILGCITAAFPLYGIMPLVLEDCLNEFYKQDKLENPKLENKENIEAKQPREGLNISEDGFFRPQKSLEYWQPKHFSDGKQIKANHDKATIKNFSLFISKYLSSNGASFDAKMRSELEGSLNRRFVKFTKGILGQVLCPENWREVGKQYSTIPDNIQGLLNKPCVIELEGLASDEEKALMMAFLLTYLFESRQLRKSHDPSNQLHITIIEEAHRLLSNSGLQSGGGGENASQTPNSSTKSIGLFLNILAEIRAKDEGIFIVEQSPTKLVADAVKSTNLKVMHRLPSLADRNYFGEAMNMEEQQRRYATTLKQGEAIVFDEQLEKPLLVKMNKFYK